MTDLDTRIAAALDDLWQEGWYGEPQDSPRLRAALAKHDLRIVDAADAALDVERLAQALQRCGFVRGVAQRYGRFNDTYWTRSAEALISEYARLRGER